MPVSIECPNCAARYKVGDHLAGKRVKCKKCAAGIHVPDAPDLERAHELPLKADSDQIPVAIEPMDPFVEPPPRPPRHGPLSDAVIRAEAFVAAEALNPAPAFSAGVGTIIGDGPPLRRPPVFAPEYGSSIRSVRPSTAAPEGFSPLLLLVYFCLEVGIALYAGNKANAAQSEIWTAIISDVVLFYAMVAPLTWLGFWGAAKAMSFELASPAYLKSAAIAAAPTVIILPFILLPRNPVLIVLAVFSIIPVTFFLTMLLFSLTWLEALVAWLLGGMGCILGRLIQSALLGAIMAGASMVPKQPAGNDIGNSNSIASNADQNPPPAFVPAAPRIDPVVSQLENIAEQARAMTRGNWLADSSRERMTDQLGGLQGQVEMLRPHAGTDVRKAKLDEVTAVLADVSAKIAQLPSEDPDPVIFQPITATDQTWRPSPGDNTAPVSFRRYRLEIPGDAKIDLGCTEDAPDGLSWDIPPRGRINIATQPRKDPRQERPWIRTHNFQKIDTPDVFRLDMVNIPIEINYGSLGSMPATRIASVHNPDSRFAPDRFVKYVIADGQSWVVISCTAEPNDARTLTMLENAAWSVHQARSDEPHIDPFTPEAMVARLREERAEVIVRRMGAVAEPALLARINDSDGLLREKVIGLLGQVGTKKSVPALLQLCGDENTRYAELARAAVKKLSPADMDAATEGLLDIQSKSPQARQRGIEALASAQPKADDPHRPKIAAALAEMVRDGDAGFGVSPESLGDALAVWQTSSTIPSLLPMLDYKADFMRRRTAMIVLAHTRDKRAVFPICRWLIEDTHDAQAALIGMGPVAEDDVIKVLDQKSDTARVAACNILAEIGTQKSIKPLENVIYYNKSDVDAGNAAIARIKERLSNPAVPNTKNAPSPNEDKDLNKNIWIPPRATPKQ